MSAVSQIDGFQWQQRTAPLAQNRPEAFQTRWQEAKIQLDVEGSWPTDSPDIRITQGRVQTESGGLQLAGIVSPTEVPVRIDVQGSSNLNFDALSLRLRPWLGPSIQLSGAVEKPFQLRGPLQGSPPPGSAITLATSAAPSTVAWLSPQLEGQFGLGWQSIQAYGVVAGAGSMDAALRNGKLLIEPFRVPMSQGQLRLAPQFDLSPPFRVSLDKGPVIEQVAITPEMCHYWLKYLAPLVADATTAEGLFSIRVGNAVMPLAAPRRAQIGGSMTIHQAHIGPGPLAREFLTLAQTIRVLVDPSRSGGTTFDANSRWIDLPEQVIPFRVEEGQVIHQNLTMQIGDVTIRTRGSVGFNQQLGLTAEVPILDRWVAQQPYLAGLRGQTLKIPMRGTLQRPVLDQRAAANADSADAPWGGRRFSAAGTAATTPRSTPQEVITKSISM